MEITELEILQAKHDKEVAVLKKEIEDLKYQCDENKTVARQALDFVKVLKAKLDKAVEQRNDEINSTNNPFAIDIEHKINRLNSELNSITKETVK